MEGLERLGEGFHMFRRNGEGIAVPASVRLNDGSLLIGTVNCGMTGKLETLLNSDVTFIEFMSKDGHQRFLAHHQIASVEPLGTLAQPSLAAVQEDTEPYQLLGLTPEDSLENAMEAFLKKSHLYSPERWTGPDVPFEFARYAVEKTRQINMAFTVVRAALQAKLEAQPKPKPESARPLFGAPKPAQSASS
jgi:hypothetical protein